MELTESAHEAALNRTGLLGWVLSEARIGLIGMNKEGIVSLPGESNRSPETLVKTDHSGYLAIYCFGLATGEHILRATAPFKPSNSVTETYEQQARSHYDKRRTELALELFGYSFGWWIATLVARLIGMQVSRRLVSDLHTLLSCTTLIIPGKRVVCPLGHGLQHFVPLWISRVGALTLPYKQHRRCPSTIGGDQRQRTCCISRRQRRDWLGQRLDEDHVR